MTFDDGIIRLYRITNTAPAGSKPVRGLELIESFYFGYETLGINRYYTALTANQQIEAVVDIPDWNEIDSANVVARLENGNFYRIAMTQPTLDDDGLRITRLSLERINESYDIIGN